MLRRMSTNTISNVVCNLKQVQEKVHAASAKRPKHLQHRQPRLVAVSKTKEIEMIFEAYDGGQRHFGENYVTELHEKSNDIELQDRCENILWHFIGHLQRNKISKILDVPNLYVIETVDSQRLAKALHEAWARHNKSDKLNVMVQCNTSGEGNKNGCALPEVVTLVKYVKEGCPSLNLLGLMTIGRFDHDLSTGPNPDFQSLIAVRDNVCKELEIAPEDLELSMGMSADYEHAIEVGSTNVRVGSTIFGARTYVGKATPHPAESKVTTEKNNTIDSEVDSIEQKLRDVKTETSDAQSSHQQDETSECTSADGYVQQRLQAVNGHGEKANDIFVCGNIRKCSEHIIFFGGDVQDYPEIMESHRDNHRYAAWNLEATSLKIQRKFPNSLVINVKPAVMYLKTLSLYTNFVEHFESVRPVHSEDNGALLHLGDLYKSVLKEIHSQHGGGGPQDEMIATRPLRIIGFSKGCIVLNQLVFELHLMESNAAVKAFVEQLRAMYWLDGGHSGGPENTWVTQDEELQRLADLQCQIFIHVTPYQIKDLHRPWLGKQEAKFHKKLKQYNAKVQRVVHFESDPPSIENHFNVLDSFA